MYQDATSILQCPNSHQRLRWINKEEMCTEDGKFRYPVVEGIFMLRPDDAIDGGEAEDDTRKRLVRDFYEDHGWQESDTGTYNDTDLHVDLRPISRDYTRRCNLNLTKLLAKNGNYLLDAGCGAIPHEEYLTFHQGYKKRLCVDFSFNALCEAKKKLGDKGIYIVGDLTNLPLQDGVVADAVAMHVIYHIPEEKQARALEELHRVLQPKRKALIVYEWPYAPLVPRIALICRLLAKLTRQDPQVETSSTDQSASEKPRLYFFTHDLQWFRRTNWSFKYRILPFRIVDNPFMKKYFTDHWVWVIVVKALEIWQKIMPGFTGRYGAKPVIVIEKGQD